VHKNRTYTVFTVSLSDPDLYGSGRVGSDGEIWTRVQLWSDPPLNAPLSVIIDVCHLLVQPQVAAHEYDISDL